MENSSKQEAYFRTYRIDIYTWKGTCRQINFLRWGYRLVKEVGICGKGLMTISMSQTQDHTLVDPFFAESQQMEYSSHAYRYFLQCTVWLLFTFLLCTILLVLVNTYSRKICMCISINMCLFLDMMIYDLYQALMLMLYMYNFFGL